MLVIPRHQLLRVPDVVQTGAIRRRAIRAFDQASRAAKLQFELASLPAVPLFGVLIGLCLSGAALRVLQLAAAALR